MNKNTWIGIIVIVLIIAGVWYYQNNKSVPAIGEPIKIGYLGPFTGPVAGTSGEDVGNGFKLAASLKNQVGNRPVEVIYEDDACDPAKAVSAANKLINIDKVKIVVSGVCSGSSVAVAPIAENNKVIFFTPVSESPKLTTAGDYVFRTSASSVVSAHAMAEGIMKLGYKNISILFENAEYTAGMKDAFVKEFSAQPGNKILVTESFGSKDTDLRTPLLKVGQSKPEALVFFMNSAITGNVATNQMKDLKINLPVVGNAYYAFTQSIDNPNNESVYVAVYQYDTQANGLTKMLAGYKEKFGKTPAQDVYAALSYDGYNVLFKALETCGGDDPECLKQALYDTKGYQGITGEINIDQNGDTERLFTLKQIKNKQLIDLK